VGTPNPHRPNFDTFSSSQHRSFDPLALVCWKNFSLAFVVVLVSPTFISAKVKQTNERIDNDTKIGLSININHALSIASYPHCSDRHTPSSLSADHESHHSRPQQDGSSSNGQSGGR
jgi:hypothetical protein